MSAQEIELTIRGVLQHFAPEYDVGALDPGAQLQEELDLDSMDFLNTMIAIHEATGVEIPESDYGQVTTLAGVVRYVSAREVE
jgi:acyl carrier protein